MYCPSCRCEFRAGFTHCASCDVALVERLEDQPRTARPPVDSLVEYCGFLSLDDARQAKHQLGLAQIGTEIVVRDAANGPREEFWLCVPRDRVSEVRAILGDGLDDTDERSVGSCSCSDCGGAIGTTEVCCPHCGARFE